MTSDAAGRITHGIYSFNVSLTFTEDGYDSEFEQISGPTLSLEELLKLYPILQRKIRRLAGELRRPLRQASSFLISDAV